MNHVCSEVIDVDDTSPSPVLEVHFVTHEKSPSPVLPEVHFVTHEKSPSPDLPKIHFVSRTTFVCCLLNVFTTLGQSQ